MAQKTRNKMKKNKKKKNNDLVDIIAKATLVAGICGMVYSSAADFDSEQTQNKIMVTSFLGGLSGGLLYGLRNSRQR